MSYFSFGDRRPTPEPRCCGRGLHARGTAGKGEGDIMACNACYRDVCIKNGPDERAAFADYEARLRRERSRP